MARVDVRRQCLTRRESGASSKVDSDENAESFAGKIAVRDLAAENSFTLAAAFQGQFGSDTRIKVGDFWDSLRLSQLNDVRRHFTANALP
jgi:hypothetical protein